MGEKVSDVNVTETASHAGLFVKWVNVVAHVMSDTWMWGQILQILNGEEKLILHLFSFTLP